MDHPHLYHLTVKPPDIFSGAVFCTFSQECLVLARGQWLEVLQLNSSGELETVARTNLYATIRCLDRIRIPRVAKDLLILTSDSGELTVLDFDWDTAQFSKFANCAIALPKLNRNLSGEYLAVDPRGRVALTASICNARTALVFSNEGISGDPIEVALPSTFCYSVVALDRGYENPAFACLERFRFTAQKTLVVYEFNLSLNNLFKVWSRPVSDDCDFVIPLPGGRDGPSGMLIFEGTRVSLCSATSPDDIATLDIECTVSSAQLVFLGRNRFFVLVCTSAGQLRAIQCVKPTSEPAVTKLAVTDLDINVPATPSCIATSRSGLVFVAASSGNHALYQIAELDPSLQLEPVTELTSIAPVKSAALYRKQLLLGTGDSADTSRLARFELGTSVEGLASTPLPGAPEVVFATKRQSQSKYDDLIVLGFADSSTVSLAVGEDGSVEEESEASTGIAADVKTLGIARLQHGLLQIHPAGLRYIGDATGAAPKVSPWRAPQTARITAYCTTPTQAVLVLSNNKIVYFEEKDGALQESQQRLDLGTAATALCFADRSSVDEIRSTRLFIALDDGSLREYGIPSFKLIRKHPQLAYLASSLVHVEEAGQQHPAVFYVGHFNGTLSRVCEDSSIVRVLGSSPVKLTQLLSSSKREIIALSTRAWLIEDERIISLLVGEPVTGLKSCCSFATESAPENNCLVAVNESSLEVFTLGSNLTKLRIHVDFSGKLPSPVSSAPILRITGSSGNNSNNKNVLVHSDCQVGVVSRSLEVESLVPGSAMQRPTPRAAVNARFESHNNEEFLVASFGTSISVLQSTESGAIELIHETQVGATECTALLPFNGKLLAGIGNKLVLYELGKKQLLRQYEFVLDGLSVIRALLRAGNSAVYVGDSRRSVTMLAWNSQAEKFSIVAEDPVPRSVLCMILLDSETVCIGTQYGEITILRFPNSGETPQHLQLVANFWVPDAIVGLHRGNLTHLAANEAIVYTGLQGTVGVLIPLISASETEFVETMQNTLTANNPKSLAGRVIEDFHGYYAPTRNVVDGDLLEQGLTSELQNLEEVLELDAQTIANRVEDIRYRCVTKTM